MSKLSLRKLLLFVVCFSRIVHERAQIVYKVCFFAIFSSEVSSTIASQCAQLLFLLCLIVCALHTNKNANFYPVQSLPPSLSQVVE